MSQMIYCISGLGADEQIFSNLQIPGYELVCLHWLQPEPGESFADYAKRMYAQIADPDPILMGVSFGGMLGIEIAKQFSVKKLVLISSVKIKTERPWWMQAAGKLKLHQLVRARPHPLLYTIENLFSLRRRPRGLIPRRRRRRRRHGRCLCGSDLVYPPFEPRVSCLQEVDLKSHFHGGMHAFKIVIRWRRTITVIATF